MHDSVPYADGFWHTKCGLEIDKRIAIIGKERNKGTGSTMEDVAYFCGIVGHKRSTICHLKSHGQLALEQRLLWLCRPMWE